MSASKGWYLILVLINCQSFSFEGVMVVVGALLIGVANL
jgi:hypothetical protein